MRERKRESKHKIMHEWRWRERERERRIWTYIVIWERKDVYGTIYNMHIFYNIHSLFMQVPLKYLHYLN